MKETVFEYRFIDVMAGNKDNGFSYYGAKTLFNILTDLEEDTGIEIELDPVAIRSQFTEYENFKAIYNDFSHYIENHSKIFEKEYYENISDDDEKEEYLETVIEEVGLQYWPIDEYFKGETGIIVDVESI